jgi:hypothetical protein
MTAPFVKVPLSMLSNAELSPTQKVIIMGLMSFEWMTGGCAPSHEALAERCGLSLHTIERVLPGIELLGYISMTPRYRGNGKRRTSNVYEINTPKLEALTETVSPQVGGIVSPQVGGIVSPQVGGIVSPQVGGIVSPQVGGIVSPQVGESKMYFNPPKLGGALNKINIEVKRESAAMPLSVSLGEKVSKKNPKHTHGEFANVMLTDEELSRLTDEYGEDFTLKAIDIYSAWKKEKGRTAKEDNLAIRRWVIEATGKKHPGLRKGSDVILKPTVQGRGDAWDESDIAGQREAIENRSLPTDDDLAELERIKSRVLGKALFGLTKTVASVAEVEPYEIY